LKRNRQVRFEQTRNPDMKPASRIKIRKTCCPRWFGSRIRAADGLYLVSPHFSHLNTRGVKQGTTFMEH